MAEQDKLVEKPPQDKSIDSSTSWCVVRLREIFSSLLKEQLELEAQELIRKRKLLDFMVQAGQVSAKIEQEGSRPIKVLMRFNILTDEQWDTLIERLAANAYFLAKLLAGDLPTEVEEICSNLHIKIFPTSAKDIEIFVDEKQRKSLNPAAAALMLRLFTTIEEDPFALFILLGRGKEETLAELRRLRLLRSEASDTHTPIAGNKVGYVPAAPLHSSLDDFWSVDPKVNDLRYNIRADELPASILKWLDPLPLGGLEDKVDFLVEDAYARVARLAQSFGLGH